jgi:hypothetical protein
MISETTLRSYVPHTSHFRFPNTLQNLGSGTGKPSILRDQKPIRKRDPAHPHRSARERGQWGCVVTRQTPVIHSAPGMRVRLDQMHKNDRKEAGRNPSGAHPSASGILPVKEGQ